MSTGAAPAAGTSYDMCVSIGSKPPTDYLVRTMHPITDSEVEESLTKVDVANLTRHERRDVIPACDYVVVGYDSSYSDKAESTKTLTDPINTKVDTSPHRHLSGVLHGDDADGDRAIGVSFGDRSGGSVTTSKSSGQIGTTLWVAYPDEEPPKTTHDVTFRALAGTIRPRGDDTDFVDRAVEYTVDDRSFDGLEAPPRDERRVEKVQVNDGSGDVMGRDYEYRATVDIPRTVTTHGLVARSDAVERARKRIGTTRISSYEPDPAEWCKDVAPIGDHIFERDGVGMNDRNLRKAVRYWITDVAVESVDH